MIKYNPSVAHVVYASDDRFAEILGVSLVSLLKNSKDMDDIIVYILDSGITDENKKKLLSVCKTYKRSDIAFIPGKNISEKLSMNVAVDRGSLSQYARLFVSSDLPKELNRVLYLDCDIVVKESIRELWNLNLHGKTIGALMDAFSKHYRANIDLEPEDIMFNSGVMLINLEKWREQKIEDKLLKFIATKDGKIQQGDQGALNHVLSHDTYCFEPRFNSVTIFYDFTYEEMLIYRKPPMFYTKEQVEEAVENPSVIHFTTSFLSKRAWVKGCKHRYVGEWLKCKSMSPWRDEALWDDNRPKWKQKGVDIISVMPRRMAVRIAGLMQVYGRPWMNRIKG
jgi:lipopolysaccharide biosynthesis glycosyltransferase